MEAPDREERIRLAKIKQGRSIKIDRPCEIWLPPEYRNVVVIVKTDGRIDFQPAPKRIN